MPRNCAGTTYDKAGNVLTVTDPLGRVTAYGYDALNRVTITTEAVGTALQRSSFVYYDAVGNTSAQTDPLGRTTSFGYDKLNRQISMTDALGHTTTTAYDAAGNAISTTDALGQTTKYGYDALNRQTTATDPLGHTVTTIYDANGQATATIDALGDLNAIQHDGLGQVIGTTDALGRESGAVYDAAGELKSVTDVKGNTTLYGYDAAGQQVSATDALGHTTITVYDAAGQVTSVTDPLGHTTTYHYDAAGRVTSVTDALGHTVAKTYDAADQVLSLTDANGNVTQYTYDALGRRITATVAVGTPAQATTTIAYDAADQFVSVTDPLGHITTFYYDAAGRRTAVTDALGHTTTMAYDADGNAISVTDATGAVTQYVYDAASRRIAVTDALGHTTTMAYDAADRPISVTDALGDRTQTPYDANGRVTATIDALGHTTTMVYDANGNVTSITDADGNTTAFTYDALNRKTVTTDQLGHTTTTTYDAAGRVSSITDADGRVRQFAYDAADRVTGETWISSGNATVNQLTYTYDANGNLLTASDNSGTYTNVYDAQNRLVYQTNPQGMTLAYQYDAAGRLIQRADSFGGVLNYVYDNADRLTSEQFGGTNQTQARVDLAYDSRNELTVLTRYADVAASVLVGTTGYSYDAAGRVIAIANRTANTTLLSYYAYAYDNANRVTSETWQSTTATGTLSGIHNYSYDVTSQLTADGSTAFSYDANGNRTMAGYQTGTNNHITNDGTFAYTYDAVGNIVQRTKGAGLETWYYGYDTLNRLTSIRKTSDGTTNVYTVAYTYDVMGNRSVEDIWQAGVGETITRTAFDGGEAWADLTSSNIVTTRYLWGAGGQELYARIDVGAGLRQVSQDRLGSVRDVWDGSGVVLDHVEYAAYGAISSETAAGLGGHYLYTGLGENRIAGTVTADERTEFVDIGRWLQPDPITFSAGDANINRYVGNNPTNLTDPSGQFAFLVVGGIAVAAVILYPTFTNAPGPSPTEPKYGDNSMQQTLRGSVELTTVVSGNNPAVQSAFKFGFTYDVLSQLAEQIDKGPGNGPNDLDLNRSLHAGLMAGPLGPLGQRFPRLGYGLTLLGAKQAIDDFHEGKNAQGLLDLGVVVGSVGGNRRQIGEDGQSLRRFAGLPERAPRTPSSVKLRVKIEEFVADSPVKIGRTRVEALADSYRGLPANQRPLTVARLETLDGGFGGRSAYTGGPHPVVQQLVDANPGRFSGACAECDAISQALRAAETRSGQTITTVEQARLALFGSSIQTARVRGQNSTAHGTPLPPCETCQPLLDALGIPYR